MSDVPQRQTTIHDARVTIKEFIRSLFIQLYGLVRKERIELEFLAEWIGEGIAQFRACAATETERQEFDDDQLSSDTVLEAGTQVRRFVDNARKKEGRDRDRFVASDAADILENCKGKKSIHNEAINYIDSIELIERFRPTLPRRLLATYDVYIHAVITTSEPPNRKEAADALRISVSTYRQRIVDISERFQQFLRERGIEQF